MFHLVAHEAAGESSCARLDTQLQETLVQLMFQLLSHARPAARRARGATEREGVGEKPRELGLWCAMIEACTKHFIILRRRHEALETGSQQVSRLNS